MKRRRPPGEVKSEPPLPEGDALWRHVVSTVTPIRGRRRVPAASAGVSPALTERAEAAPKSAPRPASPQQIPSSARPVPATSAATVVPGGLDRRKVRRLARGQDEITARVDLHGLTEAEAHVRLGRFVRACVSDGHRHVLVVTGKGSSGRRRDDDEPWMGGGGARRPGVLRRNVPRWLSGPEMAPYVVSFTTAHARHGGEGALYLHLRKPR